MYTKLPAYNLAELIEPHLEEIRDIGDQAMRASRPELAAGYRDDSEPVTNFMAMFVGSGHGQQEAHTAVITAVPLLARLQEMEPATRLLSVGLDADVFMADSSDFYLRSKQMPDEINPYGRRMERELAAHLGPLSLAGELLRRVDWVATKRGKPLSEYDRVMLVGHSAGAYAVANAAEIIAEPVADCTFGYLFDEYGHLMSGELAARISDLTLGEVPAVRDAYTADGVIRYAGESVVPKPPAEAVTVSEEALGVHALFKTGNRTVRSRVKEFRDMWPFVQGFRMNTTRPQLVRAANKLPNVRITSFRGEDSYIHPKPEAESLRTGKNLNRKPMIKRTGKLAPEIPMDSYSRFRSRYRSYDIEGMGHNATNSQAFFALLTILADREMLPAEDSLIR